MEETEEDIVIKKPKKRVKKVVEYVDVSGESSGEEEDVTIEPSQNLSELHDIDVDDEEYSQVQEPYVPPEENVSSSNDALEEHEQTQQQAIEATVSAAAQKSPPATPKATPVKTKCQPSTPKKGASSGKQRKEKEVYTFADLCHEEFPTAERVRRKEISSCSSLPEDIVYLVTGWEMKEEIYEDKTSNNLILTVIKEGEDEEAFKLRATDVLKNLLEKHQFKTAFKTHLFFFCSNGTRTSAKNRDYTDFSCMKRPKKRLITSTPSNKNKKKD